MERDRHSRVGMLLVLILALPAARAQEADFEKASQRAIGAGDYGYALFGGGLLGFEIGADANVALANEGLGYDVTTSTIQDPIIAFVFGQQGLMAGLTLEGSKITKVTK